MSLENWFGNSKVVDKNGNPLVVYHGSPEKFEVFEPNKMNYGSISRGFCFFTNKKSAYPNCAADYAGKDGYIYECYLRIEKPLHIKYGNTPYEYYHTPVHYWDTCQSDIRRDSRKGDFDGIIIENENKDEDDSVIYLVPNANQIKSVDAKEFSDSSNIFENLNKQFEKLFEESIYDKRIKIGTRPPNAVQQTNSSFTDYSESL